MAENDVLVFVWPHRQAGAEDLSVERPPAPSAGTGRAERPESRNQVWDAVAGWLGIDPDDSGRSWDTGFGEVIAALELQRLIVESRDNWRLPSPELEGRWGRIYESDGRVVLRSDLSLNTDGTSVPSLRMVERLLVERGPQLVISTGVGGGVRRDDQVGDVVVATQAKFQLRGSLEDIALNEEQWGATATVEQGWFDDIELPEEQELPLLPTSPAFAKPPGGWPQPAPHRPRIRADNRRPVVTRPSISERSFVAAALNPGMRNNGYLGDDAAVVDMDSAVAAKACSTAEGGGVPFASVTGIAVPALDVEPNDHERNVRNAWAATYNRQFAAVAARNAVTVMERLIERMSPPG